MRCALYLGWSVFDLFGATDDEPVMVSFKSNRDVAFEVKDLAAAEKFYGDVMGFELAERRGDSLVYETGHLTLYVKESGDPHPPMLSFRVPDLEEARSYLEENGCEITAEWDRALYFRDPLGVVHDIIKEK
jgi:catechol 2,3-dioxygenase-like lactoylglutathione lyase family enzyme